MDKYLTKLTNKNIEKTQIDKSSNERGITNYWNS